MLQIIVDLVSLLLIFLMYAYNFNNILYAEFYIQLQPLKFFFSLKILL